MFLFFFMSLPGRQIYIFLTLIFLFLVPSRGIKFLFFDQYKIVPHEICNIWCCEMPDERYVIDVLVSSSLPTAHVFSSLSLSSLEIVSFKQSHFLFSSLLCTSFLFSSFPILFLQVGFSQNHSNKMQGIWTVGRMDNPKI